MHRGMATWLVVVALVASGMAAGARAEVVEVYPVWPTVGPWSRGQYVATLKPTLMEIEAVDAGIFVPPPRSSLPIALPGPGIQTALPTFGFEGVDGTDKDGWHHKPPDTHIAVGPGTGAGGRIIMVTNSGIQIWDKNGTSLAGPDPVHHFLGVTVGDTFDPKVIYDPHSDRFFMVILEGSTPNPNGSSWIHIDVSTSSTPSDLDDAWERVVDSALTSIDGFDTWFDNPDIGADADSLFVTGNLFDDGGTFRGVKIRVFDKADLLNHISTFTDINESTAATPGIHTVRPAHVLDPSGTDSGDFYLVNAIGPYMYRFWQITGAPSSPSIVANDARVWSAGGWPAGGAPQSGSSVELQTLAGHIMNAVYRDGRIWLTLTSDADSDNRSEVFWAMLRTNGVTAGKAAAPTVADSGYLDGSGSGAWTFMPSISVNMNGQAAITYTQSSSSQFADMRYSARDTADRAGTFQGPVVAKTSKGAYDAFGSDDPDRWGDYSATVVDPDDDSSFCAANEFVKTTGADTSIWGTYVACFQPSTATTLSILARDDVPATAGNGRGVHLVVEAKACDETPRKNALHLFWDKNNNKYRAQSVDIPVGTERLRFTFLDDYCGPACPGDPDDDRNAHIDKFAFGGKTYEAEDYTITDGTDPNTPGCSKSTDPNDSTRKIVVCGNNHDFVEYDLNCPPPNGIPVLSEWGVILLVALIAAAGSLLALSRRRARSA